MNADTPTAPLIAPFPWFGGKSKVAPIVWQHFGDVDHYVEPFAGSLAVLLGRPSSHLARAETVNDLDHYIVNFWRALQAAPDEVARWADWPVTEADLTARHLWLVNEGRARIANLEADPDAYDAKVAGWWLWGICAWIGNDWCRGDGSWQNVNGKLQKVAGGVGVSRRRLHLGNAGQDINRSELADGGIYAYMRALAARLCRVRVCCGDWQRVVTPGALAYGATIGIFLDPPYSHATGRDASIYNCEMEVSAAVRAWAIANGDNPRYRIALCGYAGEHVMPDTWTEYAWTASASYKTSKGDTNGRRYLEHLVQPALRGFTPVTDCYSLRGGHMITTAARHRICLCP